MSSLLLEISKKYRKIIYSKINNGIITCPTMAMQVGTDIQNYKLKYSI